MESASPWGDSFWVNEPVLICHEPYVDDAEWEEFRDWLRAEIESRPLCSVARTLLEADERFYTTFPGSRRDAIDYWRWQQGFQGYQTETHHALATPVQPRLDYFYDCNSPMDSAAYVHHMAPQLSYSTLGVTINPSISTYHEHTAVKAQPAPEILPVAPHLVPSQPRATGHTDLVHPFLDYDEQYPSPVGTSSSRASTPLRSPSPAPSESSLRRTHSQPRLQFTGDWEADALAASRSQHLVHVGTAVDPCSAPIVLTKVAPSDAPMTLRTTQRHYLTHDGRQRVARSYSHPYIPVGRSGSGSAGEGEQESRGRHRVIYVPSAIETPPSPPPAQSKPPGEAKMACLFCRGRKIACQPPPPGEKNKTCGQCKRRQQRCTYPKENRRGMRKTPGS